VHRLVVVAALLLVPPVAVGVAELALDWGWLFVAAVLDIMLEVGWYLGGELKHHVGVIDVGLGDIADLCEGWAGDGESPG
jgi:hypothetical protein